MAKSDFQKAESQLQIVAEYYNTLDIGGFARMLKDPSYCYKFYWLEAIVKLISEDRHEVSYDELIMGMISMCISAVFGETEKSKTAWKRQY